VAETLQATAGVLDDLACARERTLRLVAHLGDDALEAVHDEIMSPLAWDLGHIAAYEDLWINQRHGGRDLVRADLAELYDAFETPRTVRGDLSFLCGDELRAYLAEVRASTIECTERCGASPVPHELVLRHELQHAETMLQTMSLAGLLPPDWCGPIAIAGDGSEFVAVPGGTFQMGAGADRFAYDNERPRHEVNVPAFRIARMPVTNASWRHFSEGGGYTRREWWSDEGWAWKEEYDITHHAGSRTGAADAPVVHVSWFEADAFSRSSGARLPNEAEWEKAAATGLLDACGRVWEWTAATFGGYPGFEPFPYREYSEVFFGDRYRVLRGGSCASDPRVTGTTFRNWDLPERRQLFAGVRLAADAT